MFAWEWVGEQGRRCRIRKAMLGGDIGNVLAGFDDGDGLCLGGHDVVLGFAVSTIGADVYRIDGNDRQLVCRN